MAQQLGRQVIPEGQRIKDLETQVAHSNTTLSHNSRFPSDRYASSSKELLCLLGTTRRRFNGSAVTTLTLATISKLLRSLHSH